jgi:cysteine-S-conjugate beta-lyase
VGKVFRAEELERLGAFCKKHGLILLSDEIYHDLIMDQVKTPHVPIAALDDPDLLRHAPRPMLGEHAPC